jgi:hypothetical protein
MLTMMNKTNIASWAQKTIRIGTKPKTQQRKKITINANLSLIQDWKHKNVKQEHDVC